jgi:hypothetical protein
VATGLEYIHKMVMTHRDNKPWYLVAIPNELVFIQWFYNIIVSFF